MMYDVLQDEKKEYAADVKVALVQAPTDDAIASVLFSTRSLGNIRSETLKAFSTDEAVNIIEKLS